MNDKLTEWFTIHFGNTRWNATNKKLLLEILASEAGESLSPTESGATESFLSEKADKVIALFKQMDEGFKSNNRQQTEIGYLKVAVMAGLKDAYESKEVPTEKPSLIREEKFLRWLQRNYPDNILHLMDVEQYLSEYLVVFGEKQKRHEVANLKECKICYQYAEEYFGEVIDEENEKVATIMDAVDFAHYVMEKEKLGVVDKPEPLSDVAIRDAAVLSENDYHSFIAGAKWARERLGRTEK